LATVSEAARRCPACEAENPPTNKFCGGCGGRLAAACPACGHANPPGQKFCGECGAALAGAPEPTAIPPPQTPAYRDAAPAAYTPRHLAEKILSTRAAFEGERKQVTVFFADVSGFTAMSERLDPEEVHAIMDRAFAVMLEAVHRYEGTVNQFLGDGVMAIFGAPIAHEDHPHRALRAALAIQKGLRPLKRELRESLGVKFKVRIGINTGPVVVGAIGTDLRMDYTAIGDTTNLAARLMALAEPGQVVVSRNAQRLREGFFIFEDLGEFQVKGKTEPVHAYALLGEIPGRTRLEVSRARGLTPWAGRDAELGRLMEAYRRAAAGPGAIVLIAGEPGVGKSRLLYELLRRLEGSGLLELEATCVSHGRSMAYHPILGLVRRILELTDGMGSEETRGRIAERLAPLGLATEEAAMLLGHFLGLPVPEESLNRLSGQQLKERTQALLRALFLRASERQPVVLVVENLHWLDPSSEEVLTHLVAGVPGHPMLLLLSARPGFAAPWLDGPAVERIALEGLPAGEIHGMVQSLLRVTGVSDELLKVLVAKGEGNPLYVEEILRQLQETGGLTVESGEARLSRADVRVPSTIHDIIAARVDRLAEPVKHTLQVAAVVGRHFSVTLLTRVAEANGHLAGHLRDLQALDFVFLGAEEPEPTYTFKHALTQEVVYGTLLERRRRAYHAAVGAALEEIHAGRLDDFVELLALHFGRSPESEKAVDYAILAAERAQRRWATAEALAQFEAALKRLDAMPDTRATRLRRIDAVVKQAEIKFALGRHAEHVQALEALRAIVDDAADPPRQAAWYCWAGFLHSLTGARPEVSIDYCRRAVVIAEAGGLEEIQAISECCLTHVYVVAGQLPDALAAGERALAAFEVRGNVWWACRTLWGLSMAANASGLWERSLEYCGRGLEHGRAVDDLRLKVVGWWRTGSTQVQRGDVATGLRCYEEALALSPTPFDAAMVRAGQGYGLIKAGQVDAGIAQLEEAVAWFERSRLRYTRSSWALRLCEGYMARGEPARARAMIEEIHAASREAGYRHLEGVSARLLGEVLVGDDPPGAATHLEAAARLFDEMQAHDELGKALAALAGLRAAAGDPAAARELFRRALGIFERVGTLDWPPRVRAALADL